ncbi:uncharacterized protein LOC108909316 [Anoplophora glabripennis]|nr:uncharacterized protein LOC108909316 [Anoplophora glabripennis]XP_018569143.1 uncharacterized protein LOC108909316 [Anoplophora glabripennis]XP_018569144.1 uncharacterized protein LOC108909316 [Anoplophora glabripennis]
MDAINYIYNRKLWKASCTLSDKNSFFHAAFGVVTNESGPYLDKRVKFRRMRWATFLTYFEDETMPPCLADILKKCLSTSDKYKHVKDQCQVDNYVSDIMKAVHDVAPEEIPILATLENIKIVLFKEGESEPVIIINPDFEILGSYPNSEKPKREAVLQLKGNVFSKMNSVEEEPALKSVKDESVDLEGTKNSTEHIGSGLIRYKKSGSAGSEGVQFQVGLLTIFFLNAIQKLRNWQLSTENKAAGKFDDVVLEWPEGATLLQAKHKQNKSKKITFEELISTNSKNDDFSLPKYFLSYKEIKKTFKLKEVIICTNATVDGNTIKFLKAQKVSPESMLHYENSDCKLYTFSDEILPYLKENIKIYYKKNFQNKDIEGLDITNENIKDFLGHLQFYSNYPPGNNVGKIMEQLLSHMNLLKNSYDAISPLEIYTKILDWFQQKDGIYLTDLYATAIFSEIWRDKHWQRLEKYNVFFHCNNLNLQNSRRMLHVIADGMCLLQEIKIFRTLQNNKTKILLISPDDGTENQKQVIDAFSLPQYTTLVIISPKFTEESVIKEVSCKLKKILDKYEYKNVVLIANCNNKASHLIGLHNNHYDVKNESITFEDLSVGTQASLLKKENIIFQGRGISLEEILATPAIEDYSKFLNYEILEKLVRDEKIYVGAPLLELDEHISQFYIKRRFKRGIKKNKYEKTKFAMGEVFPEELICEMNEKILLISDSAGTGKSTVLTNLSVTIKKKYPHLWIIRIDLKDYTHILKDFLRKNRKTINILDLLNSKYLTKFTNQLEEAVFSMKGKVVLLLDGFDEISPDYTQLVLSLLSLCREQQNFVKMFVTTRPHAALELEEKLQVEPFILQPFTEQNQIDFLTGYWMHNLNVGNIYRNKCEEYAKALIKMSCWVQLIQQGANHFAAIPLHVQMLAEIFQENNQLEISEDWEGCKEYLVADEVEPKLPESMNVTILYKMFIKKKRNVFVDKGNPSGNTAANRALIDQFEECFVFHRSLALELILGTTRCELFLCYRQTPIDLEMNVLKIGIIQKLDNEFHFVHRTFAEYFVAESLIEELQLPNQNVEFQRFLIEEILLDLQFNVIRVFFNNFLQQIVDDLSCKTFHKYQSISYEITSSDIHKFNLLHYLAENGQLAILQLILKCIELNFITKVPITSEQLFDAFLEENDSERVHGNILNTIHTCVQQEGLDVKDIFQDKTLLEYAAVNGHLEMVKFLVKQGSNVNIGNFKPLHLAVDGGHFEVSQFLIEQEADIKALDPYHHTTILYKAVLRNDITMATYLLDRMLKSGGSNISDSITPYTAAYLGRLNTLKEFVKQGLDINSRVENEESVIFGAIRGGQLETIRYLVQQGSHINSRDLWNNTALHIISQNASITSTVKLLVELGIDINAKNFNLMTALHIAVENGNFDLIDLLVNCGANVNLEDENGNTALHIAASDIQGYIIKLLVEHGANMNNGDKYGRTPLHLVTLNSATLFKNSNEQSLKYYENSIAPMDHLDIIKLLIEHGVDVNVRDSNGSCALHLAASSGRLDIAHLLMEFGADANIKDNDGRTALHLAAFRDHTDIIELLMQHNGDINIQDNEGYTIIHYLLFFVDQLDILKLIIEKGGNVNIRDKNGCTALHLTTTWGNLDAVILLVEFGIDVNVTDIEGSTALHVAVNKGHFSLIEYLVKIGVDVTVRDNCGHTVLHLAIEACSSDVISPFMRLPHHYNDIDVNDCTMQYLTFNAVDIGAINFDDCLDSTNMEPRGKKLYLDIIKIVVTKCGEVVDIKDETGCTALHLAVLKGQMEVVKLLVEHNTDVNIKDHRCCTALHLAVRDDRLDIVKLLVEHGAVVNNQDIDNNTALHIATREGHKEIVKFLVECNAIVDIKDRDGRTSLHKAVEGSNLDIVRFLIENGSDVNVADNKSVTALHIAAGWNLHLVMFLVEQGADIYVEDCTGDTPAIVAKRKGRIDIFKYLQQEQSLRNRLFY